MYFFKKLSCRLVQQRSFSLHSLLFGVGSSADRHFGSNVLALKNNAALQKKKKLILIEGSRSIETCINAGLNPKSLYFINDCRSDVDGILGKLSDKDKRSITLKQISAAKMTEYSKLDTPPGIVGMFTMPENDSFVPFQRDPIYPIFVILDNIRNPDNMGGILRTAAAAGCQAVLCSTGCVSLWNDKVLRASMLSNLYINVAMSLSWSEIKQRLPKDCGTAIAHSKVDGCNAASSYDNINYAEQYKNGLAVILCNEAFGPSDGALDFCGKTNGRFIHVPMSKPIDSLNVSVATGVILFRIAKDFNNKK